MKRLLDIPSTLDVLAILPFGYPAQPVGRGEKQRSRWPPSPTASASVRPSPEVAAPRARVRRGPPASELAEPSGLVLDGSGGGC